MNQFSGIVHVVVDLLDAILDEQNIPYLYIYINPSSRHPVHTTGFPWVFPDTSLNSPDTL